MRDLLIFLRPSLGKRSSNWEKAENVILILFLITYEQKKRGRMLDLNKLKSFNYKHLLAVI